MTQTRCWCLVFASVLPVLGQSDDKPLPYKPLTSQQRWHRYWEHTILSPGIFLGSLGGASGAQLRNDPPEWGQNGQSYAKRYSYYLGLLTLKTTIYQGSSAALGYDPRYQKCDCRGVWPRTRHAILWTFLTRNSSGATRFNIPLFAGAYGAGMLSTYWYPARYNPLTDGVREGTRQIGFTMGIDVVREFSPELKRAFHIAR